MSSRDELLATAESIRNSTAAGSVTPVTVGDALTAISNTCAVVSESVEYWVDPQNGNDTNAGTEASPFRTYARARTLMGDIIPYGVRVQVHLLPSASTEGIDEDAFWNWPVIHGELDIIGEGTNVIAGPFTLNAIDDAATFFFMIHSFTGSPGWTPNQYSGYELEVASAVDPNMVGLRRTITYNYSDRIATCDSFFQYRDGVWSNALVAGDTLQVVEPAVKIKTATTTAGLDLDEKPRMIVGGAGVARDFYYQTSNTGGVLRLRNLELYVPDDDNTGPNFTGNIDFYGVVITSNFSDGIRCEFVHAEVRSGVFSTFDTQNSHYGSALASRARNAGGRRPELAFRQSNIVRSAFSVGPIDLETGRYWFGPGNMFDGTAYTNKHAAFQLEVGSHAFTSNSNSTSQGFFLYSEATSYDVEITRSSHALLTVPWNHVGVGGLVRARHGGQARLDSQIVVHDGTNGTEDVGAVLTATPTIAHYNGQIRFVGIDGSSFGNSQAGQVSPVVRDLSASPLSVNDIVDGSESSHIYRTA